TSPANPKSSTVRAKGFTFELNSCKMAENEVLCQLTITNNNPTEMRFALKGGSRLFDEFGSEYPARALSVGAKSKRTTLNDLVPDVGTHATLQFIEVANRASRATLDVEAWCNETGSFKVTFRNVTIVK
ncbi:MAG TPA: hypothetical protein VFS90_02280, partial [Pyrinomonadaceae bacterium]|nr:hypothetical protein [Pyrinomonadaceae bacterium]